MYSDQYIPGRKLDRDGIKHVFEEEVFQVVQDRSFMGIWQVFAMASVLRRPIFSIYPKHGNVSVRRDLHRCIEPREFQVNRQQVVHLMWTSTQFDMTTRHWVPNHFVPVLPVDMAVMPTSIDFQRWRLMRERRKLKIVKLLQSKTALTPAKYVPEHVQEETQTEGVIVTAKESCNIPVDDEGSDTEEATSTETKMDGEPDTVATGDVDVESNSPVGDERGDEPDNDTFKENVEHEISEEIGNKQRYYEDRDVKEEDSKATLLGSEVVTTKEVVEDTEQTKYTYGIENIPTTDLLNKYVIVLYDKLPYPGFVVDVVEGDVYVRCMHQIGINIETCSFFWPTCILDECWYSLDNVMCIIPEPTQLVRKYHLTLPNGPR